MKRKPRWTLEMLTASLAVLCGLLLLVLLVQRPTAWLLLAVLVVLWGIGATLFRCKLRRWVVRWTSGTTFEKSKVQFSLEPLSQPAALLSGETVLWYNSQFRTRLLGGQDVLASRVQKLLPGLDLQLCRKREGQLLTLADGYWSVHSSTVPGEAESMTLLVLNEETELRRIEAEYKASRPGYLAFQLDGYDDVFGDLMDSERARLLEGVNRILEDMIGRGSGFLRRVGSGGRYIAVVEERQLEGGQSRFIRKAQEDLTALLSGLEAHIDYPDEIGEDEALSGLCEGLDKLIARLDGAIDDRGARIVREGLRVALCGRPNAGKSTLFNALLGEDRAIVTDIPGTTRDVLEGAFMLDGTNVLLQDTAGLRDSGDAVERIGVERARAALGRADVALLVVDASQDPDDEALDLLRMEAPCPCAVLLNKEDAGERFTASQAERLTDKRPILRVSAREGEGLDAVREYLRGFLRNPDELALTHERHMAVARQVLDKLRDARAGLASGGLIDLAAVDLHEALYLLGRITGDSVDEKLLDDIFSRFCVGK